jgi:dolichol-phosphate mannosyltransferase
LRVAVILPAYNEEGNVTPLVEQLVAAVDGAALDAFEVLFVDDGSRDGTAAEVLEAQRRLGCAQLVRHPRNLGMAAALKTGIAEARSRGFDAAVFMDCDLSHRASDVPKLIAALAGGADAVVGSRFVRGGGMEGVPWWRALISRTGNAFGRVVLALPIRDLTSGFRAMRMPVFDRIRLDENGFTIQLEMIVKAHAAGFRVIEEPIVLGTRRHGVSHMNYSAQLFRDYWRLLRTSRRWLTESAK